MSDRKVERYEDGKWNKITAADMAEGDHIRNIGSPVEYRVKMRPTYKDGVPEVELSVLSPHEWVRDDKVVGKTKLRLEIDVEVVEKIGADENTVARAYYPDDDDGQKIVIKKGLNTVWLSKAIFHEIGHMVDWYINGGFLNEDAEMKEKNASVIGEALRWKESSDE